MNIQYPKILVLVGTRPEAIKLAPVIRKFRDQSSKLDVCLCVTAQHREMLDQVLNLFKLMPDYDLNVMRTDQTLHDLTITMLSGITNLLKKERPNMVMVQGDTTTSFVGALAAYYLQIPVAHVEAGLRTQNKLNPFPEEINRRLISVLADIHFSPTKKAKENLLREGVDENVVVVTGNTVIDALMTVVKGQKSVARQKELGEYFMKTWNLLLGDGNDGNSQKVLLVTGHRRESIGAGFQRICNAMNQLARGNPDIKIIYPVHLNPNVQGPVYSILGHVENIHLLPPLDYDPLVFLMSKSYMVLTDSGGIQEEAPALGKPVLVLRDTSERMEGIEAGTAKLVGTDTIKIIEEAQHLLKDENAYQAMSRRINPYGDGLASKRICEVIANYEFKVT
jgi:UDP-N-acetylglucosamine 2-epimerase (non-hydrolysing)